MKDIDIPRTVNLPVILTTEQVAEYLGIAPGTLANMRLDGHGPDFIRRGRIIRYRVEAILDWLDDGFVRGDYVRRTDKRRPDNSAKSKKNGNAAPEGGEEAATQAVQQAM